MIQKCCETDRHRSYVLHTSKVIFDLREDKVDEFLPSLDLTPAALRSSERRELDVVKDAIYVPNLLGLLNLLPTSSVPS